MNIMGSGRPIPSGSTELMKALDSHIEIPLFDLCSMPTSLAECFYPSVPRCKVDTLQCCGNINCRAFGNSKMNK